VNAPSVAGTVANAATPETLVGRERELALVDELLGELADGGRPRLVLSGEPGSGKSALLDALRSRAQARGARVLRAAGDELLRETPLGFAAELLGDELAHLDARTLTAALEEQAAGHGVVLLCDDLQWADETSLALIARLLSRPPQGTMPVVAHRTGGMPDLLARTVGLASADGEIRHVELGPLDQQAAAPLLAGLAGPRARRVYEASGGNPFYLSQLAAAARDGRELSPALRAALVGELSRLSGPGRELVWAAALLGPTFDPRLAAEVAGLDATQGGTALDELERRQLVRMTDVPERCAFRRPIVATVAQAWAGDAWCAAAHTRAAALLAARDAPIAERARHVERSARPGDLDAAHLLQAAGMEIANREPAAAARWFAAALRLMGRDAEPAERLPLLLERASTLANAGELAAAQEPLAAARALLPLVGPVQRAQTLAPLARVDALLGHRSEPIRDLEDAECDAALQATTAAMQWCAADWSAMADTARAARDRLAEEGRADLRCKAAALLSIAERQLGHTSAARSALAEAEWIADGGAGLGGCPEALAYLAVACDALERFESSIVYADALDAMARGYGQQYFVGFALVARGAALLSLGRVTEAEQATRSALDETHDASNALGAMWSHALACRLAIVQGDLAAAADQRKQTLAGYALVSTAADATLAAAVAAEARIAAGEFDEGIAELLQVGGGVELELIRPTDRTQWAALLAEAEQARGDLAAARAWSRRASAMAAAVGSASAHGHAERARALVLLAEGDAGRAATAAAESADSFDAVGREIEAAAVRALGGTARAEDGDVDAGVTLLRRAHDALAAAGAERDRERVAGRLRRLGRRVRGSAKGAPRPAHGPGALSPREREIAELVGRGATNRQIADHLVISEKTVESHLTRIFAKLGVSTRTAAAHVLQQDAARGGTDLHD
jgi:DNA-binding NarL/FixJ family response regulator